MSNFRISAYTLLLIVLHGVCIAHGQSAVFRKVLAYSAKQSSNSSSFVLKSPRGITYRLSLVPERDVKKHVVVLNLVLQEPGQTEDESNLLDSTGSLHGYQPYVFAASDFADGAKKSVYGASRVIDLPKLGMHMHIKVADVQVEPTSPMSSQVLGHQFENLTLEMTTQSVAEGLSSK